MLRRQLVTGYLPLARSIARRYAQRGEPLEDLTQVACLGLVQAIERYYPEHGCHFLAFAVPTITGEIRRYFRDKTWAMRVPRRIKDLQVSINNVVVGELSQQLGRAPRPSDLAARLDVTVADILDALEAVHSYHADSLDHILSSDAGTPATLGQLLGQPDPGLERFTNYHSLAPVLAELPAREREILIMRFYGDMTQKPNRGQDRGFSNAHIPHTHRHPHPPTRGADYRHPTHPTPHAHR